MVVIEQENVSSTTERTLHDTWKIADVLIPNRVVLAPLAGIGNWFVRLQAKRYGAGLAVSEMVSSFAITYRNEKTCRELLRIDSREQQYGPTALQLFGHDPDVMYDAARYVAQVDGVDIIDLNMGCPVPKVCKTGAGAALLENHDLAVAVAKAAQEGSGLPVTVKLRSGRKKGDRSGVELAQRLVNEAGVAAITFHPRCAQVQHKGSPDLDLACELVELLDVPVILSGGMRDPEWIEQAWRFTQAQAIMLARGALGNPWLFSRVLGIGGADPSRDEVLNELSWVVNCAIQHLGNERAVRYLRKFYPWYVTTLAESHRTQDAFQRTQTVEEVFALIEKLRAG